MRRRHRVLTTWPLRPVAYLITVSLLAGLLVASPTLPGGEKRGGSAAWASTGDQQLGHETFWNYHTGDLGGGWRAAVNTFTGNLVVDGAASTIEARGPDLTERLTYNSGSTTDVGLSGGWLLANDPSTSEQADGSVALRDPDGTVHTFARNADGTYTSPAGVHLTLRKLDATTFETIATDETVARFNSGRLSRVTDANNNALTITRDTSGRITKVTDASGRVLTYTWSSGGRLESISDPEARLTAFAYDSSGRLATVTDPSGAATQFGYDSSGRLATIVDANGGSSRISYDSGGRVTKLSDPRTTPTDEYATSFSFDPTTLTATVTDPAGNATTIKHNSGGNPTERTDPVGNKVTWTWQSNELVNEADATGAVAVSYDANGNPTKVEETITSTQNAVETASYDADNNPTVEVDANGGRTEHRYDATSNPTSSLLPARLEADANTYDSGGNLTSKTDPGAATYNQVDNGGFERTDSTGAPVSWSFGGNTAIISRDLTVARFGTASLKMSSPTTSTTAYGWTGPITVTGGQQLTVSADARLENIAGGGVTIGLEFYDANGAFLLAENPPLAAGTGNTEFVLPTTAPATAAKVYVTLRYESSTGSVWFDGVQLESPLATNEGHIRTRVDYVDNSSFEYGGRHWFGTSGASVSNEKAFGGASSLKVARTTTGTSYAHTEKIGLRPDEPLTLSGLITTSNVTGGDGAWLQIQYYSSTGTNLGVQRVATVTGTTGWTRYAGIVTPPASTSYGRVFAVLSNATGTVYFDNLKLTSRATTRYSYDTGGNYLTATTDPLGNTTSHTYDAVGNPTSQTDPAGYTTSYTYDKTGRVTAITDPTSRTTRFAYDPLGNGLVVRDARSASASDDTYATRFTYDPTNRRTSITDPVGNATSYTHDRASNLTRTDQPGGGTVTHTYDKANRRTTTTLSDGPTYSYRYDGADNLLEVADHNNRSYIYSYDKANRPTSSTDLWGYRLDYARDAVGNITSQTDSQAKTTSYKYRVDHRLLAVTDPAGRTTSYYYDDAGRLFHKLHGNGHKRSIIYDGAGRVLQIKDPGNPGPTSNSGWTLEYTYDSRGNITKANEDDKTQTYTYDALGRLTSWTNEAGTVTSHEYDAVGNLTKKGAQTFTVNAANRITNPGYSYDPNGNLTADPTHRYTYDAANRLIRVTKADGTLVADYTYDHRGLRTQKTTPSSTTRYHWDERNRLIRESDSAGATLARYTWDDTDQLVAIGKGGALYYVHANQRGDILSITDTNRNRVATYTYGPWGELLAQTGTFDQPWRYAGYYHDNDTGLYYLQARYYKPELGRFLSPEPLFVDGCGECGFQAILHEAPIATAYAYALGNPLSYTDPDGHHAQRVNPNPPRFWYPAMDGRVSGGCPCAAMQTGTSPENTQTRYLAQ